MHQIIFVETAVFFFAEKTISSGVLLEYIKEDTKRERERRVARDKSEKHLRLTSGATISRVFAEKSFFDDDRGRERFFFVVGFDREERRCVF